MLSIDKDLQPILLFYVLLCVALYQPIKQHYLIPHHIEQENQKIMKQSSKDIDKNKKKKNMTQREKRVRLAKLDSVGIIEFTVTSEGKASGLLVKTRQVVFLT